MLSCYYLLVTYILSNTHRVKSVMLYTTPQENAKHLMGTTQHTVSTQPRPEQEPGNLERKTETDRGAGQKN